MEDRRDKVGFRYVNKWYICNWLNKYRPNEGCLRHDK